MFLLADVDWTTVLLALIAGLPAMLASMTAAVLSFRNTLQIERVADKVEIVHKATNSMKDQLVAVTRSDAMQTGHAEGRAEIKAEQREAASPTKQAVVDTVEIVAENVEVHKTPEQTRKPGR